VAARSTSRKVVFTPAAGDLEEIAREVRRGRSKSVSSFVRDAVREKLRRLQDQRMFDAVERYCAEGADDTDDLLAAQAVDDS
jgi:Arc/MetJ-type ribon-helix-helix transcriptional regulator